MSSLHDSYKLIIAVDPPYNDSCYGDSEWDIVESHLDKIVPDRLRIPEITSIWWEEDLAEYIRVYEIDKKEYAIAKIKYGSETKLIWINKDVCYLVFADVPGGAGDLMRTESTDHLHAKFLNLG